MFKNLLEKSTGSSQEAKIGANLEERVSLDLARIFAGSNNYTLDTTAVDVLIHQGRQVAVVEVKTGDPELPLPTSTVAQMRLLTQQARHKFPEQTEKIIPVLVMNYKVTEDEQQELDEYGIKVVSIATVFSRYSPQGLSKKFAQIVGLDPRHSVI